MVRTFYPVSELEKMYRAVDLCNERYCRGRKDKMVVRPVTQDGYGFPRTEFVVLYRGLPVSNGSKIPAGIVSDLDWLVTHNLLNETLECFDK